jgi:hypothetical protein
VLIISGVQEEGSRESGSYNQKQFEKRYELPSNVDLNSMASYVNTQQNQLIVEIPLIQSQQKMKELSNNTQQQRFSFAINRPDEQWEQTQQKSISTSTNTSSTQGISASDSKFQSICTFHIALISFSAYFFSDVIFLCRIRFDAEQRND